MHVRCLCIFIYVHMSFKSALKLMCVIYVHTHICKREEYMHIQKNCEDTNISLTVEISLQIVSLCGSWKSGENVLYNSIQ